MLISGTIPLATHQQSEFWDALAAHHAALEDNYLGLASLRRIMGDMRSPVLVVGAGQGLLVADLHAKRFKCDGVDFSSEMIRHAKSRRGLDLIHADACALPLTDATYETIIYATGVVDFNQDEVAIRTMLSEGRRVLRQGGKIFVAFHRLSPALEDFLTRVGLLSNSVVLHRRSLETYLLSPSQLIRWTMKNANIGWFGAAGLILRMAVLGTIREKAMTLKMQKVFRAMENPQAFVQAASETQPYRNEAEIRRLFERLNIPTQGIRSLSTCWVAQI